MVTIGPPTRTGWMRTRTPTAPTAPTRRWTDAQDDDEPAQDGAGDDEDDAEGDDSDQDEPQRHGTPQAGTAQAWEIILAERNEAGEWHTVGEPVPDARFPTMDLAFDYATRLNCRDFGRKFDWANDPGRAWVAVRVGTRGRL